MAPTGLHLGQQIGQSVQLTLTAHEEAQAAAGRLQAAAARASSDELVDDEGLHPAPDRDRSPGLELNVVDRQTRGRVAHEDTPRLSQLLQAGGEMRNVADGGVVHPEVVANGADDHEAGMHPHPEAQAHVTAGRQGKTGPKVPVILLALMLTGCMATLPGNPEHMTAEQIREAVKDKSAHIGCGVVNSPYGRGVAVFVTLDKAVLINGTVVVDDQCKVTITNTPKP
jgi:hypothetical protein